LDLIGWDLLCANPNAMHILEKNQDKIDYFWLSCNPNIFTYDYEKMHQSHRELKEELMKEAWRPSRVAKWLEQDVDLEDL
jgi:hypothetical protein